MNCFSRSRDFDNCISTCVFFTQKIVSNMLEVMGVAVIMSRPQTPFLKRWKVEMEDTFDGEKCYACHSTVLSMIFAWHFYISLIITRLYCLRVYQLICQLTKQVAV